MLALIETARVRGGAAPLWPLHLARLAASSAELGLEVPIEPEMPRGGPDRIVRLVASSTGVSVEERAYRESGPLRLAVAAERHTPYPHKTTVRDVFDRALVEARDARADDALLLTREGFVAEAAKWGLYWWEGDRLCAPARALGVLRSVARARIEQVAGPLAERTAELAALRGRPLFAANAARGVVPVGQLGGRHVPQDARTEALAASFWP